MSAHTSSAEKDAGKPIAFVSAQALRERMHDAVNDPHLRSSFRGAMDFLMAKRAAQFPDESELASLRTLSEGIRQYSLARLPDLLEQLEANLTRNGVQVHWAETPAEANAIMLGIAQRHQAKLIVKGQVDGQRRDRVQPRHGSRRRRGARIRHGRIHRSARR